jgi:DNA-binding MarR family transcriptional regulator
MITVEIVPDEIVMSTELSGRLVRVEHEVSGLQEAPPASAVGHQESAQVGQACAETPGSEAPGLEGAGAVVSIGSGACTNTPHLASIGSGACTNTPDLESLDDQEARHALVGQTARFTASFLRWMEGRACDGMNYARLRLLQALHCGGPAIMRDLGTQLGTTPRNMTAMVDALEQARLVVRRPHPTDRRATLIELSPAGVHEATQAIGPRLDAMSEIFAGLSPAERENFSAVMTKLMLAMRDRAQQC